MSEDVNSKLSHDRLRVPGQHRRGAGLRRRRRALQAAFDIYQSGYPANEFIGLPVAEELMRTFDEELQGLLNGDQSVDEMLEKAQEPWTAEF